MKKTLLKVFISLALLFPGTVFAAGTISITPASIKAAPGEEFIVTVKFETGDATVNAVSGKVTLDPKLSIGKVLDGSSVVPIWIEAPARSEGSHEISFAGIIPGGLYGPGELFRFVAVASSTGKFKVSISDVQALAQGQTPAPIAIKSVSANISISGAAKFSSVSIEDTTSPQELSVSIQKDPNLFDGAPFAVFSAADKQSGIERYEAAFSYLGQPNDTSWTPVESPYLIPKAGKGKLVWIRAVDQAGNYSSVHIGGPGYYRNMTILAIIIGILLCLAHFVRQRSLSRSPRS